MSRVKWPIVRVSSTGSFRTESRPPIARAGFIPRPSFVETPPSPAQASPDACPCAILPEAADPRLTTCFARTTNVRSFDGWWRGVPCRQQSFGWTNRATWDVESGDADSRARRGGNLVRGRRRGRGGPARPRWALRPDGRATLLAATGDRRRP